MLEHPCLDIFVDSAETRSNVFDAVLSLGIIEDCMEELTWLLVVGVGVLIWVSSDDTVNLQAMGGVL